MHSLVDLRAQPRHLALADATHAHSLNQFIDRTGRDALDVGLLDHGGESLLRGPSGLQKPRKIAAFAQLRDLKVNAPGARLPEPLPVTIAAVGPIRAPL